METNPKRLLRFVNGMLKIAWVCNIVLIVFVLGVLIFVFVSDSEHNFDLKVKYYDPPQAEVIHSVSGVIKEAVAHPDQYLLKMKVANTPLLVFVAIVFFLLFEGLLMTTLYQLRKMFDSFSYASPFSLENVRRLKITALCFALYLPLDALIACVNYLILQQNGLSDRFMLVADLSFTWLIIAVVIYIMADIFRYGFELQQENKEFV